MPNQWYFRIGDREDGPVSLDELKKLVLQGRLAGEDRVRKDHQDLWIPARRLKGLFGADDATAVAATETAPGSPTSSNTVASSRKTAVKRAATATEATRASYWKRWFGRRELSWTASLFFIGIVAIAAGWWAVHDPRFPQPYDGDIIASGGDFGVNRVRKLLPPPRETPSIPGLKRGVATLVPGLEKTAPAFSPCLSSDLKTIVFASMRDLRTRYDLFLATRERITEPFGVPQRIEACVSNETEAYPSLSPDGLQLLFVRSDSNPTIMFTQRKSLTERFPQPEPWQLLQEFPEDGPVGAPQFIDSDSSTYVRFAYAEKPPAVLEAARPEPEKSFQAPDVLPFSDPWPLYYISSNRLRAFYGSPKGLFVVARQTLERRFGTPELFAPAEETGPIDGPIWVVPQEDVLFYCSPGPGKEIGQGRKLWMYRY
mgnify:CR=1 FL=1|jgi:hypothetical protein